MDIHEIKSADFGNIKEKQRIIRLVTKAMRLEEAPDLQQLLDFSNRIGNKYKITIYSMFFYKTNIEVNIKYEDSYSTFRCSSIYEALCKHILYVKAILKLEREKENV